MEKIYTIAEMTERAEALRRRGLIVGFVPTMGALHEGHLSLVRASRESCTFTAASVFVNPAQFGPSEDFERYPRTFEEDCALLESEGCDLVVRLEARDMYPQGYQTWVDVTEMARPLCGRFRPGHFRGVATVVLKLLHIVRPHRAFFGWKDAQQGLLVRRMVEDLNVPVEIRLVPTVRDADGLALSSRNRYLSPDERRIAGRIPQAIARAKDFFAKGGREAKLLLPELYALFEGLPDTRVDYISIVRMSDLEEAAEITKETLLAIAVRVGSTRLIDNHRFAEDET